MNQEFVSPVWMKNPPCPPLEKGGFNTKLPSKRFFCRGGPACQPLGGRTPGCAPKNGNCSSLTATWHKKSPFIKGGFRGILIFTLKAAATFIVFHLHGPGKKL